MAEEHKKSFMLYFDNFPCVAALDAEQRGELLLLLYRYAMAADKAPTDPEEVLRQHPGLREETRMAYRFLAETIRRDTEKWKEKQRRYQEAAARLHVTDKAVSKWERGLSYPDVTLLEPLAAALDLTVEELMACRRQAAKGAEETMQSLLDISRDSVRQERRRSWQRLAAVLVLLAVTAAVVAYTQIVVTEEREDYFVLKETVDGANYLYVELPWEGRLLRLRCVGDVDFDGITLEDEFGCEVVYDLDCRWNRLTYTGTVSRCAPSGSVVVGHMEGSSSGTSSVEVFGMRDVLYAEVDYHQNPHGEGFLCDAAYWLPDGPVDPGLLDVIVDGHPGYPVDYGAALLVVENCVSSTPWDADGDGANEIVVRTRWPEKPYTVYDMLDGEVQAVSWPDAVPEEVRENLMCIWEQ